MKTLIAEDDCTPCKSLENNLKEWGYEVVAARAGNEARELARSNENFLHVSNMELIQASDNALLSAKKNGRNRIILSNSI